MRSVATRSTTLAILACIIPIALTGCAKTTPESAPPAPVRSASAGDAVELAGNLSVRLVSVDASAPPQGRVAGTTETTETWLQFEVVNTGEASATLPSRPVRPIVTDGKGNAVDVAAITAGLKNGGGGWGPASSTRGVPYLNPGGSMMVFCGVRGFEGVERPITIQYSPTRGDAVTFVVDE